MRGRAAATCTVRENIYGRPSVAGRCSAVGVDTNKDSGCRRRVAIKVFAAGADYLIIGGHHGAAVSGADPVERRPASPPRSTA